MSGHKQSENDLFVTWIIWGALLFSQLIYLVVLYTQTQDIFFEGLKTESTWDTFTIALCAIAFLTTIIGHFVYLNAFKKTDIQSAFVLYIVSWALADSVSIYGLVLGFSQYEKSAQISMSLFAIGILSQLMRYPKKKENTYCSKGVN